MDMEENINRINKILDDSNGLEASIPAIVQVLSIERIFSSDNSFYRGINKEHKVEPIAIPRGMLVISVGIVGGYGPHHFRINDRSLEKSLDIIRQSRANAVEVGKWIHSFDYFLPLQLYRI